MAVRIRLSRFGKKDKPTYRIVVIDARSRREGKTIEIIGHYNPQTEPASVKLDKKRYEYWLSCGAQPTDTVRSLARKISP